jgi:hypothetical protein
MVVKESFMLRICCCSTAVKIEQQEARAHIGLYASILIYLCSHIFEWWVCFE